MSHDHQAEEPSSEPTSTSSNSSALSPEDMLRYARHLQLPGAGSDGQLRLKRAHVVVVGCGGLGAPVSQYLAAAGVGCLTLVDPDSVELSNLQRQINFSETDIGLNKARQTRARLNELNSEIQIEVCEQAFGPDNAMALAASADIVVDCTDNFTARYLINDVCKLNGKPWLYASIHQFSGQLAFFKPGESCFRCLFPSKPTNATDCNSAGVLGVLPGILGTLQASEVLRYLLGLPVATSNKLMMVETSDMQFQKINLQQKSDCPACNRQFEWDPECELYQSDSVDAVDANILPADFMTLTDNSLIVDVRDSAEHEAFNIGGQNVPMGSLSEWLAKQPQNSDVVFYCLSGIRSANACEIAREHGLRPRSLAGGIQNFLQHTEAQ